MFRRRAISMSMALGTMPWLLVVLSPVANAQQDRSTASQPERFAEFDRLINEEIAAGRIVGCAAALMTSGQVVYDRQWGDRDRENSLSVEPDTIWRIYSMTKPITSAAAMQLVDQGKIQLDEPVATYLPEFAELQVLQGDECVDCVRPMTVRDLLRHTSGLTYGFMGNSKVGKEYQAAGVLRSKDLAEMTQKLGKISLVHQPGARWQYSVSTDVLGRVIEVVSGMSLQDYFGQFLFEPLDMKDTFFTVPKGKLPRLAQLYAPNNKGGLRVAHPVVSHRFVNETEFYSGGGGLCSTTRDYLRFCQMLLGAGEFAGTRLLETDSVREMMKNQLPAGSGGGRFQFGLGFHVSPEGHCAWGGAAGTRFWIDPHDNTVGIFMIQINPFRARDYGRDFKRIAYGK